MAIPQQIAQHTLSIPDHHLRHKRRAQGIGRARMDRRANSTRNTRQRYVLSTGGHWVTTFNPQVSRPAGRLHGRCLCASLPLSQVMVPTNVQITHSKAVLGNRNTPYVHMCGLTALLATTRPFPGHAQALCVVCWQRMPMVSSSAADLGTAWGGSRGHYGCQTDRRPRTGLSGWLGSGCARPCVWGKGLEVCMCT